MRIRIPALRLIAGLGIALSLTGCIFQDQAIPAGVVNVSGGTQTVAPNAQAAKPLTVRVVDQDKEPLGGITIEWVVQSGSGALSATSTTTDENGESSVTFTAGANTGSAVVLAKVPVIGSAVSFTIAVQ
jgi:hypothetical protein